MRIPFTRSSANRALTIALPVLAVRVGSTQSNMSTPRAITSITPSGSPMPMKYRAEPSGRNDAAVAVASNIGPRSSPTESPPIA